MLAVITRGVSVSVGGSAGHAADNGMLLSHGCHSQPRGTLLFNAQRQRYQVITETDSYILLLPFLLTLRLLLLLLPFLLLLLTRLLTLRFLFPRQFISLSILLIKDASE